MADLFGSDLLINPSQIGGGAAAEEAKEIPISDMDGLGGGLDLDNDVPNLVPKAEDIGQHTTDDGFVNLNAESFMPSAAPSSGGGRPAMTPSQINEKKRKILGYFDRMQRRGRPPSRRFTMDDTLEDMEAEKKAMSNDNNMEFALKLMENVTLGIATVSEYGASAVPRAGIRLNGYSNSVNDTMEDFYPIFEEMWDKYQEVFNFGPEMKYVYLMMTTAYMTHMTNTFTQAYGPAAGDVMKENPELAKQFAAKYMEKSMGAVHAARAAAAAAPAPPPAAPRPAAAPPRDILSEMASFLGIPGGGPPNAMASKPKTMSGPQNVDDILRNVAPPVPPAAAPSTPRSILKKPRSERNSVTLQL